MDLIKHSEVPLLKFYTIFVYDSLTKKELQTGKLFSDYFSQNSNPKIEVVIECSDVEKALSNQ